MGNGIFTPILPPQKLEEVVNWNQTLADGKGEGVSALSCWLGLLPGLTVG